MELTRERALELHRQMWTDMQRDLGDEPSFRQRHEYKFKWCAKHFPINIITCNCFLCEYSFTESHRWDYDNCDCPIQWPKGRCEDGLEEDDDWRYMPISKLLALPEREVEE